jgi:hypothetical protein
MSTDEKKMKVVAITDDAKITNIFSELDFNSIYNEICFKGFDISKIKSIILSNYDAKVIIEICTLVALRGTNYDKLKQIKIQGKELIKYNTNDAKSIKPKITKKDTDLCLSRFAVCFADYAAYGLLQMTQPKKVDSIVPSCFQFGSMLSLPWDLDDMTTKNAVEDFLTKFTVLINGQRNDKIESAIIKGATPFRSSFDIHVKLIQEAESVKMKIRQL